MSHSGLDEGDDYAVIVYRNGISICEVTGTVIGSVETAASLYTDGNEALLTAGEILGVAFNAARYYISKPHLREMLQERIAQLRAETEEAERLNPPAPSSDDIPF